MYGIVYHLSLLGSRRRGWNRHLRPCLHFPRSKYLHRGIDAVSAFAEELRRHGGTFRFFDHAAWTCAGGAGPSSIGWHISPSSSIQDTIWESGVGSNSIGVHTSPDSSIQHSSLPFSSIQQCFVFLFFVFGACLSGIYSGAQYGTMRPAASYRPSCLMAPPWGFSTPRSQRTFFFMF